MMDGVATGSPRLWISYPWIGREERDFSYLVSLLKESSIDATYDSLEVEPDKRLFQRILQRLLSVEFDGWLYILTHQLLTRKTGADELVSAIEQTQQRLGTAFPIMGLLHGVNEQHVPPVLRVRPCLSVADGDWRYRILKALTQPVVVNSGCHPPEYMRFKWRVHAAYGGNPLLTAIEVAPKNESIPHWRFAIPSSAKVITWGAGRAEDGEITPVKFAVARGTARYGTYEVSWFGAANAISSTESAYVIIAGPLPDFVCFGPAKNVSGTPGQMEVFRPTRVKCQGQMA